MKRVTLFCGHYGSGKTNIAVNYALFLRRKGLEVTIADLSDTLSALRQGETSAQTDLTTEEAKEELRKTMNSAAAVYAGIRNHMEELYESPFYTTYAEHTAAQGKLENFLTANLKKMLIYGAVGALLALALWFLSALAPEFRSHRREEEAGKEASGK